MSWMTWSRAEWPGRSRVAPPRTRTARRGVRRSLVAHHVLLPRRQQPGVVDVVVLLERLFRIGAGLEVVEVGEERALVSGDEGFDHRHHHRVHLTAGHL